MVAMNSKSRSRSRMVADIAALIIGKYPVPWKADEVTLALGENRRTIDRALKDMLDSGLLEKKYHSYTLSAKLVNQIYGAQWYVRQTIDKDVMLKTHREKNKDDE